MALSPARLCRVFENVESTECQTLSVRLCRCSQFDTVCRVYCQPVTVDTIGFGFVMLFWQCCEVATAGQEHKDGELVFIKILPSSRKSPTLCRWIATLFSIIILWSQSKFIVPWVDWNSQLLSKYLRKL